ncbi:hypothetical protein C5F47_07145 [Nitrosopumilus cobalaminigenes]|uniref:Uncharacterized protein n=2 Tax=Nitrosopumilus cobalaminigenes TaxID=1470066 RepID=A0A7D5R1L9_9ARCH|nr:hypothetical protein C5F47_07145 [Nitrosopumilus cobalaminigenes]
MFAAIAMASILLISGFGLSSASAQTSKNTEIKLITSSSLGTHSVVFQVCAKDIIMRSPEVIITSDSQVKTVKLNKALYSNTCKITSSTIKAFDKDTIQLKKVDKSKINSMINEAEKRLIKIKSEISNTNTELEKIISSIEGNDPTKRENIAKINDLSEKLTELRKDLKDSRNEYYNLLFVLRN